MSSKPICLRIFALASALYIVLLLVINYVAPTRYIGCDLYTKEMNGGVRSFAGQGLNIVLCGYKGSIGPDSFSGDNDQVRLQIFSMEGELLAQRYFEPLVGLGEFGLQLKYGTDFLVYNDGEGTGFQTRMAMPPDRLDWLRARLPRFLPLIFWP